MKTLKSLIAALLILTTYNSFADGRPANESSKHGKFANALFPQYNINFANPLDIYSSTVESLKNIKTVKPNNNTSTSLIANENSADYTAEKSLFMNIASPKMEWGNPEDVKSESVVSLKFINYPMPEMIWGTADDVNLESVNFLKIMNINAPEMVWGNPEDVNTNTVEGLKYVSIASPEMNFGSPEDVNLESVELLKNLN
ncbi:MAG: hypothetical protein ABI390_07785 [Daejeonella sp.]